jgi:hypothetical protein
MTWFKQLVRLLGKSLIGSRLCLQLINPSTASLDVLIKTHL